MIPYAITWAIDGMKHFLVENGLNNEKQSFAINRFVESLGYKADTEYLPWKYNNQIGGFRQRYGKLIYQTIMGSGHMAPMDQPGPSQAMFNEFLTT